MVITAEMKRILTEWERAKEASEQATRAELDAREAVVKSFFPNPYEGTLNVDLGDGDVLKGTFANTFKLDKDKAAAVSAALPKALRDLVIKWEPKLSVSNYRALEPAHKSLLDSIVTMTPSRPSIKIETPKRR